MLKAVDFSQVTMLGDLAYRAVKNYARLEGTPYKPSEIFERDRASWPGDWVGRTMLAWVLLAQSTGRKPAYLDRVMDVLPDFLNEKGYVGPILPPEEFDEQQFSGHSWLLRALCELYEWRGEARVYEIIKNIVGALVLPARGHYQNYPIHERIVGQAAGSHTGDMLNHWHLSTDTCCAFIPLDGFSHAYSILRDPALLSLLDEMAGAFMKIDLSGIRAQTHASLSACRGLIRMAEILERPALLSHAQKIYHLYRETAMTANGSNFNWFGRPEWTEPCAMVDSLMVAMSLWRHTGGRTYIDDAHHIYYNALGFAQRPNGGFGCDTCAGGDDSPFLSPREGIFEAFWCCSMRGGEGLSRMCQYAAFSEDHRVFFPFYHDCALRLPLLGGVLDLRETAGYPIDGDVRFAVNEAPKGEISLHFYRPIWAKHLKILHNGVEVAAEDTNGMGVVHLALSPGDVIALNFDVKLRQEATRYGTQFFHGPLLLGLDKDSPISAPDAAKIEHVGGARYTAGDRWALSPINNMIDCEEEAAPQVKRRILF